MIGKTVITGIVCLAFACTEPKKERTSAATKATHAASLPTDENNAQEAKQWLIESINNYFATVELGSLDERMKKMTTAEYYAYKTDASNVDLDVDGGLTRKQFYEKWKGKFDTSKAGVGTGFLISGQDWDNIEIKKCELVTSTNEGFLYDLILYDDTFKRAYPSRISVVRAADEYKIADVQE